jgi:biopolymer transport protein ExbD
MQFRKRREMRKAKIEIIPMIDTMFFLLVFFMLSSLALTRQNGLPVNLPKASTAPKQPSLDLTITVDPAGKIFVNKDEVELSNLAPALINKAGGQGTDMSKVSVVINADRGANYGTVIACMDEARTVGITKFGMATEDKRQ